MWPMSGARKRWALMLPRTAVAMRYVSLLPLLFAGACDRSRTMEIPVTVLEDDGNSDLQALRPGTWDLGEIKDCQQVPLRPTQATEAMMLCGRAANLAWAVITVEDAAEKLKAKDPATVDRWMTRDRAKTFLEIKSKVFDVQRKGSGPFWRCRKTADGLVCESMKFLM